MKQNVEFIKEEGGEIFFKIGNEIFKEKLLVNDHRHFYHQNGAFYEIEDHSLHSLKEDEGAQLHNLIQSPMPGTVTKINFKEGDIVEEGKVMLSIEAMKMENKIIAQKKLKILKIRCDINTFIEMNSLLMEVEFL